MEIQHYYRPGVVLLPCDEAFALTVCNYASRRENERHPTQEVKNPTRPTSGVMCTELFIIAGDWIDPIPGLIGGPKPGMG